MSLQRLTITLHCWPARRPVRRGPAMSPEDAAAAEERPARRFALGDVTVEGDDVRDIERFDSMVADAMADAAVSLARLAADRLGALRDLGYATRLEIAAVAEGGPYELALPVDLVDACHRLGLSVQLASDPIARDDADADESFADAAREE